MKPSSISVRSDKTVWNGIVSVIQPSAEERLLGESLLEEWRSRGHIRRTCREMLELPDGAIASFYEGLSRTGSVEGIASRSTDSGWMADADFCFVNVRATGLSDGFGNFLHAAKLLPALRVSAIHLAPFLDYERQCIYLQRAERTADPRLLHLPLIGAGFPPEIQVKSFVEACHLLGKACGFDLEPHQTQFSRGVMERPDLFRWAEFREGKLAEGRTMEENFTPEVQTQIVGKVGKIVRSAIADAEIGTLEETPADSPELRAKKRETWLAVLHRLISQGLWTVTGQAWDGVGLPRFDRWHEGNYPLFEYRNASGEDRFEHALRALTPLKFGENLPVNRVPHYGEVSHSDAGAQHLAEIFVYWRDLCGFDFVRYDSFDHLFDSELPDGTPASDRPTGRALNLLNRAVREGRPGTGILAERMGNEIGLYAGAGCDLTLGDAMLRRIDAPHVHDAFRLNADIAELNETRRFRASVCFTTDTHDTGNPHIWGDSLVHVAGFDRMLLRHFVSRFLGCGTARRPKYEAMGSQDLSHGLYRVNVKDQNLDWVGDTNFNEWYHRIEDVWEEHRAFLANGELADWYADDRNAWWVIHDGSRVLVAAVSLETAEGFDCGGFTIPLPGVKADGLKQYNVGPKRVVWKTENGGLYVEHLDYLGCALLASRNE
jgi:hypothetical protein